MGRFRGCQWPTCQWELLLASPRTRKQKSNGRSQRTPPIHRYCLAGALPATRLREHAQGPPNQLAIVYSQQLPDLHRISWPPETSRRQHAGVSMVWFCLEGAASSLDQVPLMQCQTHWPQQCVSKTKMLCRCHLPPQNCLSRAKVCPTARRRSPTSCLARGLQEGKSQAAAMLTADAAMPLLLYPMLQWSAREGVA
jgi:hypothetical protein